MRSLMPRSLARSSSRSVSGVAARRAAQSSRPIVRNRLPASITPRTLRSPRARAAIRRRGPQAARRLPDAALARRPRRRQQPSPAGVAGRRRRRASTRRAATAASSSPRPAGVRELGGAAACSSASTSTPQPVGRAPAPWPARRRRRVAVEHGDALAARVARRASTSSSATRRTCRSWRRRRRAAAPAATAAGRTPTPPSSSSPSPVRLLGPTAGGIGLVLPQSILASRDAAAVRAELDRRAGDRVVVVVAGSRCSTPRCSCARWRSPSVRRRDGRPQRVEPTSSPARSACPPCPSLADRRHARRPGPADGELPRPVLRARAGRRRRTAPGRRSSRAASIDPGRCALGRAGRVTFARRRFDRPTVELGRLDAGDAALGRRPARAQGARRQPDRGSIEAVADDAGAWLPGRPG